MPRKMLLQNCSKPKICLRRSLSQIRNMNQLKRVLSAEFNHYKTLFMKNILIGVLLLGSILSFSQKPDSVKTEKWKSIYRASATKINDLVNTKLDVSFDLSKSWMYGKAWITLHPHFYPTDSLNLDAKSMNIIEVSIIKAGKHISLKFSYDSLILRIQLDRSYNGGENYTVFIDYIAKPNDIRAEGSAAILSAKGLYFINPLGNDKNKPTQIWTQGETESNSGWFPTIDKPCLLYTSDAADE